MEYKTYVENIFNNSNYTQKYLNNMELEKLVQIKNYLDDLYYNSGDSFVSDEKYDLLVEKIKELDPNFIKVGTTLREGENRIKLPYWLGSADKITPQDKDELQRWVNKNKSKFYVVMEKLDGVSCLLIKKKNNLFLYTRGDGEIGADISYLSKYIKNIPDISQDISQDIAIRGELIMEKKLFNDKYRDIKVNGRIYKNSRNMVSGLIGGKSYRDGLKDILFIPYEIVEIIDGNISLSCYDQLKFLKELGFRTVEYRKTKELNMENLIELYSEFKSFSKFSIDGIIIQSNELYDRNTDGNPNYLFAFKMLSIDDIHETEVLKIEWNISKWGNLKPVVILKPVKLNDITINRATAHNAKYVEDNNLGKGAIIKVTRSMDVIPYIVEVVKGSEFPEFPEIEYVWDKNHVNISTVEPQDIMCIKLISSFFEKLNIKYVSEATVKKLFENGFDNLMKIISATKEELMTVPTIKEKSAERIVSNIKEGLANVKISTLIGASGVLGFGMGRKRMDSIFLEIPDILKLYKKKSKEEMIDIICKIDGFSRLSAEKIADNLKIADIFLKTIKKYVTIKKEERVSSDMIGKKFVITGFRDKNLEEEINKRGGKITSTVSKNTTALIVLNKNSDKSTSKLQNAIKLGIEIYEKTEFVNKFINS
jgi:DNA ligase (NAD+)